jgi:hypothetical protein
VVNDFEAAGILRLRDAAVFLGPVRTAQEHLSLLRRRVMHRIVFVILVLIGVCSGQTDLNVNLMKTTFMVKGQSSEGATLGTAFLLLRPFAAQPDAKSLTGLAVLVTAAHVFNEMTGDTAEIFMRTQQAGTEQWTLQLARFNIRKNGHPLWTTIPKVDVAVMYVALPAQIPEVLPVGLLADDALLKKENAGPGIELNVLGFPLGIPGNNAFFPVLRTGMIASYPILPTDVTKTFLLDFRVFKGNSGGPVYYSPREMPGTHYSCCPAQFLMGLVSQEASLSEPYSQLQLSLGLVVHASLIKTAIDALPAPESKEAQSSTVRILLESVNGQPQ